MRGGGDWLVFPIAVALELLALGRDVHPKTAMATYGAGTLDLKADDIGRICGRG